MTDDFVGRNPHARTSDHGRDTLTVEALACLLEGRPVFWPVRLAVTVPGIRPLRMTLVGATTLPNEADGVWLLSGTVIGEAAEWWWSPERRLLP